MLKLQERFLIVRKWLLSFRKVTWRLDDYPVIIKRQRAKESPPVPTWTLVPWVARIDNLPFIRGSGDTFEEAYASLSRSFAHHQQRLGGLPRPGRRARRSRPRISKREASRRQQAWIAKHEAEAARIEAEFGALYPTVISILGRHDPLHHVANGDRLDAYKAEAHTILPRLHTATSEQSVQRIIHEEFQSWFGPSFQKDASIFAASAHDIWDAWLRWRAHN